MRTFRKNLLHLPGKKAEKQTMPPQLVCFDCDSTLSAIEGIDELARLRGPDVFAQVERMTREAMDGGIALEEIFARRLELIRPHQDELRHIGELYVRHIEPEATDTLSRLRAEGWTPVIVSGGFRQAIFPLARHLGIERVEAVDIFFHDDGTYHNFGRDCPTARARGKNAVIAALKAELHPARTVMVGDGASDMETSPDVDLFVGFGRYAMREKVKTGAGAFILRLGELPSLLQPAYFAGIHSASPTH
ncbi:MAG: HAD-IB family phosphatase [Puniceicoccales bacterium]|nr:HAD-IB family phosphatase [Puniceicoccales bacterium]